MFYALSSLDINKGCLVVIAEVVGVRAEMQAFTNVMGAELKVVTALRLVAACNTNSDGIVVWVTPAGTSGYTGVSYAAYTYHVGSRISVWVRHQVAQVA